jgi:LTXXQ motif family protein
MPAWNKFADALLAAVKSIEESMEGMHKQMMQSGAAASLPEKLEHHAKMAAGHLASLQAIKTALEPLYASFSDEQKKFADALKIGPMGVM